MVPDPVMLHRAQSLKAKPAIPHDLLKDFCGFTHVSLRIYCRKIADPERRFKKSARPYEGVVIVHLADDKGHVDQYAYCTIPFSHCSRATFLAAVNKILSCDTTLMHVLLRKTITQ